MLRRQVTQPAAHRIGEGTEHLVHRQRAAHRHAAGEHDEPVRFAFHDPADQLGGQCVVLPTPPIPCSTSPATPGPTSSTGQRRCSHRRPTNSPTWRASNPAGNRGLTGAGARSVVVAAGSSGGATRNGTARSAPPTHPTRPGAARLRPVNPAAPAARCDGRRRPRRARPLPRRRPARRRSG